MKKWALFLLSMLLIGCPEVKYPSGRDTAKSFGNGRFQIFHMKGKTKVLYDIQLQKTVAHDIDDWAVVAGNVCTFDRSYRTFIILDLKSGHFNKYKHAHLAPVEFRSALQKIGD